MTLKSVAFECALLLALAFAGDASARPESTPTASAVVQQPTTTVMAEVQHQMVATSKETQAPAARNSHKEHYQHQQHHHHHHQLGGKLSIVRLILIIGKVIAPLVGAILEPLLVNIVKGITWAITYTLATGFDKPPSYEHFVPALHHHGGGGDDDEYDEGDGHHGYESHKPVTYSLNDLPGMALQLTSTVISESANQPEQLEAVENAEKKLAGLLSTNKPSAVQ